MRVECRHRYDHAPTNIKDQLDRGRLTATGKYGGVCDWRVPPDINALNGEDVACVGPKSPDCPDNVSGSFVPIGSIVVYASKSATSIAEQ